MSQKGTTDPVLMDRFENHVYFTTVRITRTDKAGKGASIGTGFILKAPIPDTDMSLVLLVSNKHVLKGENSHILMNFHKKDVGTGFPKLGEVISFGGDQYLHLYEEHPDPNVDLACLNIAKLFDARPDIYIKFLTPAHLADFSEPQLVAGGYVWFVGYPENRFDIAHNLPILRRGYIASIPQIDFNKQPQFLIDAQVFRGSSGSPVFADFGREYKMIGVVAQTMIRNEQLQAVPANVALGVQQILGLGIVLKSLLVSQLIEHVVTKYKEKMIKKQP